MKGLRISKKTIYKYFPSKETLAKEVFSTYFRGSHGRFLDYGKNHPEDHYGFLLRSSTSGILIDLLVYPSFTLNYLLMGMAFSGTPVNMVKEEDTTKAFHYYDPILQFSLIALFVNLGMLLDVRYIEWGLPYFHRNRDKYLNGHQPGTRQSHPRHHMRRDDHQRSHRGDPRQIHLQMGGELPKPNES